MCISIHSAIAPAQHEGELLAHDGMNQAQFTTLPRPAQYRLAEYDGCGIMRFGALAGEIRCLQQRGFRGAIDSGAGNVTSNVAERYWWLSLVRCSLEKAKSPPSEHALSREQRTGPAEHYWSHQARPPAVILVEAV